MGSKVVGKKIWHLAEESAGPLIDISELELPKLLALGEKIADHLTGANAAALVYIGDRLGLFKTLATKGPLTGSELADTSGLNERYVVEWAHALVAAGYLEMEPSGERYFMTKEQIFEFADEKGPGFMVGAYQLSMGAARNAPRLLTHFRKGGGIPYAEIGIDVTQGVERLWAPCHEHFLGGWLEAVPGLADRLRRGGAIADVGCGRGRSAVALAALFPDCEVLGIDKDATSIDAARALARARGAGDNLRLRALAAEDLDAAGAYDFIYMFYTLHDIPEPLPALKAVRAALKPDGVFLCVESSAPSDPMASRSSPGRTFATISPLYNLTVAMAESEDGAGTILTESTTRSLAEQAGFSSFERIVIDFPPPSVLHGFYVIRP